MAFKKSNDTYYCSSIVLGCVALLLNIGSVSSHGRMLEPAQRSSLWRMGYQGATINYNDNELFCGGFTNLWDVNNGKCGVCGDPYQGPRENEAGGIYAHGIIARTYKQGAAIKVEIDLTANHKGYFEYRLCVHNKPTEPVTDDCFKDHLLYILESDDTKYPVTTEMGNDKITMTVQLPVGVICSQCVLRWRYNAGNSHGCDEDGACGIGYGKQEQFVNCADIAITDTEVVNANPPPTTTRKPVPASTTQEHGKPPSSVVDCPRGSLRCVAKALYVKSPGMTEWCNTNCNLSIETCPDSHCQCVCEE